MSYPGTEHGKIKYPGYGCHFCASEANRRYFHRLELMDALVTDGYTIAYSLPYVAAHQGFYHLFAHALAVGYVFHNDHMVDFCGLFQRQFHRFALAACLR